MVRRGRPAGAQLPLTLLAWLSLLGFVIATLGSSLLGRTTLLATDLLARYAPWASAYPTAALATEPVSPTNPLSERSVFLWTPIANTFGAELQHGWVAQWTPYQLGGVEGSGIPTSGMWSPMALLHLVLPGLCQVL